ncbi:hypothetical protein [Rubritepida flocculans]|uniref:hypothetical protein n=1 Tax=Rubritepida flocculans TaxID=182403 RepID=UPI00042347E9|nr:hypothetical protein [Rubritepida flocculans]
MQRWRPLGHVHVAAGESPWHASHATYPTPLSLPDGRLRVFFSPRDAKGRSSIFSLDLALEGERFERLGPPDGPWLEPGPRGAFDDAGASVAWVGMLPDGGVECLYLGWSLGVSVPFRTAIGRATAPPGARRMTRDSPAPLLDRSAEDPFVLGYPWALDVGAERWLWYGTHLSWGEGWLEMDHPIRRAVRGPDGLWRRDEAPCLRPAGGEEFALSRPSLLRDAGGWHMWYCRRLPEYRLGYAHSADGLRWRRDDAALRFPEAAGWEEGVRCYPAVFDHGGRRYMLHNGAGYGRSGFGLAVLETG